MAALLNFFLPGLGYVYVGIGRDSRQMVFGVLMFVSLAVVFYAGVAAAALSPPSAPRSSSTEFIGLLSFVFPFAVAYDGYHRAKSP